MSILGKIVFRAFGAALAVTLASSAMGQDNFDVSKKQVGDVTRWQTHSGNTSVTYLGKEGRHYVFDFERDGSKGQPYKIRFWTNEKGESVKSRAKKITTRYRPHDCSLTIGRCTFREKRSDGGERKVIWNASVKDSVWSYTKHHTRVLKRNLLEEGTFRVDEFGYYLDRKYTGYYGGKAVKGWAKRVR